MEEKCWNYPRSAYFAKWFFPSTAQQGLRDAFCLFSTYSKTTSALFALENQIPVQSITFLSPSSSTCFHIFSLWSFLFFLFPFLLPPPLIQISQVDDFFFLRLCFETWWFSMWSERCIHTHQRTFFPLKVAFFFSLPTDKNYRGIRKGFEKKFCLGIKSLR